MELSIEAVIAIVTLITTLPSSALILYKIYVEIHRHKKRVATDACNASESLCPLQQRQHQQKRQGAPEYVCIVHETAMLHCARSCHSSITCSPATLPCLIKPPTRALLAPETTTVSREQIVLSTPLSFSGQPQAHVLFLPQPCIACIRASTFTMTLELVSYRRTLSGFSWVGCT